MRALAEFATDSQQIRLERSIADEGENLPGRTGDLGKKGVRTHRVMLPCSQKPSMSPRRLVFNVRLSPDLTTMERLPVCNLFMCCGHERRHMIVRFDPHFELSTICCAFLIADSSGALSFFRMSIALCAEAVASFLLPSFA
jgi:hypothetical protein